MWEWIFIFAALILSWKQRGKIRDLNTRVNALNARLSFLQNEFKADKTKSLRAEPVAPAPDLKIEFSKPMAPTNFEAPPKVPPSNYQLRNQAPASAASEQKKEASSLELSAWKDFEKKIVENWTGILGSVAMVAGVGFLGVYAALQLEAFSRFVLISGFAALLFAGYIVLRSKPNWQEFGHWLGSAAAAIFLFGCVGSGGIPGLKWITNPWYGLALLLVGIFANFGFAYLGGTATFASLHTILSILALCLHPNEVTLVCAVAVSLAAIRFSFRYRWDLHLILTLTSFFSFIVIWRFFSDDSNALGFSSRLMGMGAIASVALAAGLVHYRKDYASKSMEALPLAAHIINWIFAGIGFAFLSVNSKWKTIPLLFAAIACFLLAKRAKALQIRWLHRTDTLISQIIFLLALISFSPWGTSAFVVAVLIFVQALLFSLLMKLETDDLLQKWSEIFVGFSFLGIFTLSVVDRAVFYTGSEDNKTWASLLVAFVGLGYLAYAVKKFGNLKERLVEGACIGLLPLVFYLNLMHLSGRAGAYSCGLISLFILARAVLKSNAFGVGVFFSLAGVIIVAWTRIAIADSPSNYFDTWVFSLVAILAIALTIKFSEWFRSARVFPEAGVYLLGPHLLAALYFISKPFSALLPGVLWLLAAPALLEAHQFICKDGKSPWHRKASEAFLQISYVFIVAFIVRHIFYHLQVEDYLEIFKIRLLIELLGISVFAYFLFSPEPSEPSRTWDFIQPLFLEVLLLSMAGTVVMEVPALWNPLVWCFGALIMFRIGSRCPEKFSRLRFYSLLAAWAGAIHVAAITSSLQNPGPEWYFQPWFLGMTALFVSVIYLTTIQTSTFLEKDEFPTGLGALEFVSRGLAPKRNLWIYYPFFISMGIFAYWRFESAIKTLVFVVLSFIIFSISILHRVPHFRLLALGILGVSMVRLVIFDLAQSGTLTRGIVFLGVGGIMMLMNVIYRRFHRESV